MKQILGNTPKCYACLFFQVSDGFLPDRCVCQCAQYVNGRKPFAFKPFIKVEQNNFACENWIECESGFTRYEYCTGISEIDGLPLDYSQVILSRLI